MNDTGYHDTDGKHIAIAIFTSEDTDAEKAIAKIAKAVYAELTR